MLNYCGSSKVIWRGIKFSVMDVLEQGGPVVRVLDFESVGPGFESHSEHFMDLFHGSPEL